MPVYIALEGWRTKGQLFLSKRDIFAFNFPFSSIVQIITGESNKYS